LGGFGLFAVVLGAAGLGFFGCDQAVAEDNRLNTTIAATQCIFIVIVVRKYVFYMMKQLKFLHNYPTFYQNTGITNPFPLR
jgi:hypothetical protein